MTKRYELRTKYVSTFGGVHAWEKTLDSSQFASVSEFLAEARSWYEINDHNHYAEIFQVKEKKVQNWTELEGY
ncbi:hypothetical protein [Spirillospora sp. NPDC047279]|uniref:hypothetical protein n=1 Tax=Spirillospora sp. NPDC047279 TaxID=3155478 RepID=UPI0033C66DDD